MNWRLHILEDNMFWNGNTDSKIALFYRKFIYTSEPLSKVWMEFFSMAQANICHELEPNCQFIIESSTENQAIIDQAKERSVPIVNLDYFAKSFIAGKLLNTDDFAIHR